MPHPVPAPVTDSPTVPPAPQTDAAEAFAVPPAGAPEQAEIQLITAAQPAYTIEASEVNRNVILPPEEIMVGGKAVPA